jgi:hypothetical protein
VNRSPAALNNVEKDRRRRLQRPMSVGSQPAVSLTHDTQSDSRVIAGNSRIISYVACSDVASILPNRGQVDATNPSVEQRGKLAEVNPITPSPIPCSDRLNNTGEACQKGPLRPNKLASTVATSPVEIYPRRIEIRS